MPATGLMLAGARPIAAHLGVRENQVLYWCKAGFLPHFRVGRTVCADPRVLDAWLAERQGKVAPAQTAHDVAA